MARFPQRQFPQPAGAPVFPNIPSGGGIRLPSAQAPALPRQLPYNPDLLAISRGLSALQQAKKAKRDEAREDLKIQREEARFQELLKLKKQAGLLAATKEERAAREEEDKIERERRQRESLGGQIDAAEYGREIQGPPQQGNVSGVVRDPTTAITGDPQQFASIRGLQGAGFLKEAAQGLAKLNQTPKERRIMKDAEGFQRFVDDKSRVFPGARLSSKDDKPFTDIGKARSDLKKGHITDREFANLKLKELKEGSKGMTDEELFKRSKDLRAEFTKSSEDFVKLRDAIQKVRTNATDPSGAGDLSLIFNYMKILDPGSVVRESEFATAASTGSYGARIQGLVAKAMKGERLAPQVRADFLKTANELFSGQKKLQDALREDTKRLAKKFGIDPELVLRDFQGGLSGAVGVPPPPPGFKVD